MPPRFWHSAVEIGASFLVDHLVFVGDCLYCLLYPHISKHNKHRTAATRGVNTRKTPFNPRIAPRQSLGVTDKTSYCELRGI